jgi:hypothetical protein
LQKIYFIFAWVGWIWLVIAGAVLTFALWRKKRKGERRGFEVKAAEESAGR